ncbi:MAG: potassium-transporting ATPase subunit KdpC [Acidobacteria bacterium]|nr:potassium-transporting ATPase subunit KdpC [Acidobacteriota bacterium]
MRAQLRLAVRLALVTMLLFGGAYHLVVWAAAVIIFPRQAEGSLLRRVDGTVIGSRLIGQSFSRQGYFHPRPSAVAFDAASSAGSNYGPSHPDHRRAVEARLAAFVSLEGVDPRDVPSEMLTASGAGLDPHISPAGALVQTARVASARGLPLERVRQLVRIHIEHPLFGVGRPVVNVLELNLALDAADAREP